MFSTSMISTIKKSDPAFEIFETACKSVFTSARKDQILSESKVFTGRSEKNMKKESKSRKNLDTKNYLNVSEGNAEFVSQVCSDIEFNMSVCINQLGSSVFDVESPLLMNNDDSSRGNELCIKKRIRRRPEELESEKKFTCPYSLCEKAYTSKCSLYLHIKRNHREFEVLKEGEVAPIRINSKVKKGVDIYKVFKKSKAETYDCRIEPCKEETSTNYLNDKTSECDQENLEILAEIFESQKTKVNCKSADSIDTDCNSQKSEPKTLSLRNISVNMSDIEDFQVPARNEIFSWEQTQAGDGDRKDSVTSINVEEPVAKFENANQTQYQDANAIDVFSNDDFSSYCDSDHVDNCIFCWSNDEFSKNALFYEKEAHLREVDNLLDFNASEDCFENNNLFDFEYELPEIQPRKAIKIL